MKLQKGITAMRTKCLAVLAALAVSITASADVLLWTVNNKDGYNNVVENSDGSEATWQYAILKYESAEDGIQVANNIVGDTTAQVLTPDQFTGARIAAELPAEYATAGYSYWIELYSEEYELVSRDYIDSSTLNTYISQAESYSDWVSQGKPSYHGTYTSVPEPSSGLMLLVGAALLSLRRKKRAV